MPWPLCQVQYPVKPDSGTLWCGQSGLGQPLGAEMVTSIAGWSLNQRLTVAAQRAVAYMPEAVGDEFRKLLTPASIGMMAALGALWAGSQFAGVGELADAIIVGAAWMSLGSQGVMALRDLAEYVDLARHARTSYDLDLAAQALARAVGVLGVASFLALILGGAKAKRIEPPESWKFWEAYDFSVGKIRNGELHEMFTMRVRESIFRIKPNATKHMTEFAQANFRGPGTTYSQTNFPLSSLAGSLEQAGLRGYLTPLRKGELKTLGTPDKPFRVGDWELAIEFKNGVFEVFHAVYKQ